MADETEQSLEGAVAPTRRPGMMTLVKALAFVSVVVLVEVVVASMLVPSAEETAKLAEQLAVADTDQGTAGNGKKEKSAEGDDTLPSEDMREVSLGAFHVLSYDPDTGSTLNVDFELYGTVLADEENEFYRLFEINRHRIHEQVLITIRGMEATDFTDAGLGLIKRKILEKTNRSLGLPLVREAVFSTFSFNER